LHMAFRLFNPLPEGRGLPTSPLRRFQRPQGAWFSGAARWGEARKEPKVLSASTRLVVPPTPGPLDSRNLARYKKIKDAARGHRQYPWRGRAKSKGRFSPGADFRRLHALRGAGLWIGPMDRACWATTPPKVDRLAKTPLAAEPP
jgi:hypothetical protein